MIRDANSTPRELGSQAPRELGSHDLSFADTERHRAFVLDSRSRAFEVASLADMDFHEEDASRLFGTHRIKNLRENHATKTFRTVYFSAEEANYTRC